MNGSNGALYERAARMIEHYMQTHTVQFNISEEEANQARTEFCEKFSPEQLQAVKDEDLLSYMFLTADSDNDSLCYHIEFNKEIRECYGSIAGGSSFKYGLFQRKEDSTWITGAPTKPQKLTNEQAVQLARKIRSFLVEGCRVIRSFRLVTAADYEALDDALNKLMGNYASYVWIQKYFTLIFPGLFVNWYMPNWQKHILYGFGIEPSSKYYATNGQLALVQQQTGYTLMQFHAICQGMFGEIKHFYRLGSSNSEKHYAEDWQNDGCIAVGWYKLGDLSQYIENGVLDGKRLSSALSEKYYPGSAATATKKANEIKTFYKSDENDVFVVMDGTVIQGFVDSIGSYYFDNTTKMANCKKGVWHTDSVYGEKLPETEGLQTTCYEIKKPINLIYLYKKYFGYDQEQKPLPQVLRNTPTIHFHTGIDCTQPRNRIYFGAPGTGKSYTLNHEKDMLLSNGGAYERVTFHPDYSYANFVGTYKPVPCKDSDGRDAITYAYVPGPFMRVYVNALRNSMTAHPQPFLLIIEEINRANMAAVFGDVFQLLDRDDDDVSEYPIQASEDVKRYLAEQLGGDSDSYSELRIPDNMFLWATMNSADQGVFPMDTAFKRRWDFTYLGIDDSEDGIIGKRVVLGQAEYQREVEWNQLRHAINETLMSYKLNEDKPMGPYFISKKLFAGDDDIDPIAFADVFKSKVIMYLFEDAARQRRSSLFSGCEDNAWNQYSKICREFDTKGVFIFCDAISSRFPKKDGEE